MKKLSRNLYFKLLTVCFAFVLFLAILFLFPSREHSLKPALLQHSDSAETKNEVQQRTIPRAGFKPAVTTLFWVGEPSNAENAYIPNDKSAWDSFWQEHYGGVDDPNGRCDFYPCTFIPKENPFYVALPYTDYSADDNFKKSVEQIPWYMPLPIGESYLKNRWVEIEYNGRVCFGQWEDTGPNEDDDFGYVFGNSTIPKNTFGARAGLDVSPALWTCLGLAENEVTYWKFINQTDVPNGPWKRIVTTRSVSH
ncbi:MAG TPA: hypothetical protein VI981_04420 [Candidatus Paceibacterota bacterium]